MTDPQCKPEEGSQPQFLMAEHPDVMKPLATYTKHSSITKMAISQGGSFAEKGKLFISFFGHMAPMTGKVDEHGGHRVIMVDPGTFESTDFLTQKHHSHSEKVEGESGHHEGADEKIGEGNAASAGPRRLVDVQFSPDGDSLYVVDYGVMLVDEKGITPKPGTGVIWQIRRDAK